MAELSAPNGTSGASNKPKRCVMCKKLLTGAEGETTMSFPGRGKSFGCCSGKCFAKMCKVVPETVKKRRER